MVASFVAGISPCYRGRNGSLMSIGQKGRFMHVENAVKKSDREERKNSIILKVLTLLKILLLCFILSPFSITVCFFFSICFATQKKEEKKLPLD